MGFKTAGVLLVAAVASSLHLAAAAEQDIHAIRVLNSVPLTEENFERAKHIRVDQVPRQYPIDVGGPLSPKFFVDGVEVSQQTKVGFKIALNAVIFPILTKVHCRTFGPYHLPSVFVTGRLANLARRCHSLHDLPRVRGPRPRRHRRGLCLHRGQLLP